MGDRIGLTGDPLLFQYCELASSSAFSTPQNDSTLCFFKSISNVSSMNNISMDSQLSQEHAASVLGLFDGSLQESTCTVDQKPPRKNCLHTNQNLRTRTVSAQAISFSLGNWTDSLESVNLKPQGQRPKLPLWLTQTPTSYVDSSWSLDQIASREDRDGPASLFITQEDSELKQSFQSRADFLALKLQRIHNLHQLKEVFLIWRRAALTHSKGSNFFYIRLMGRVFIAMRNSARATIKQRELLAIAVQHDRQRVCRLVFHAWVRKGRLQRAVYLKSRIALHHRNVLTRSVLFRWLEYSNLITKRRIAGENLAKLTELHLQRRIWKAWMKFVNHQRTLREGFARFKVVREHFLKLEAFCHWKRRSWQLPCARLIAFKFERSRKATLLRLVFSNWRHVTDEARAQRFERQMVIDNASHRIETKLKAVYFHCWQECLDVQKKYEMAVKASGRRILLRTFDCWKLWTAEVIHQKCLQSQAKCFLELRLKISFFTRWIDVQREHRRISILEKVALSHWALTIEATVWKAWQLYLRDRQIEQTRRRFAYQRYLTRLAKQALTLWLTSAFSMQIGQLSQTRISKINQNFVVMKFYQIWIGALPLQQRCSKHSMDIQGSQMYFSEQWVTGEDYERGAKDCFVCSSNIHLNYQGLHPRIPQCIMDTCKKQIISEMSTWSKEIVKNESLGNALTQLRTFPSAFREQRNNEALCLGEAAPGHLAKGSFWLSEFYRISNGLLEGLHNALGVQRRTRKLKRQLFALEAAKIKERDPMLKTQIVEEICQVDADIRTLKGDLHLLCQSCNDSLCKLSKILF